MKLMLHGLVVLSTTLTSVCAQDLPAALQSFQSHAQNPVFTASQTDWDSSIRERGWIIRDKDQYRMWYTGYDTSVDPVTMKLGYATSMDGVHWQRHPQNPIYDDLWVEDMMVIRHGDTLLMFAEGKDDQSQLLKSSDGLTWVRSGILDVRLTNGEPIPAGPFGTPTAFLHNGVWHLFYERRDQGIWLATSTDLKTWRNLSDEPLIVPGPDGYDRLMIAMNQVIEHEGRFYAVLHGTGTPTRPRQWCTYLAVSDDLRNWTKCKHGPILPIADNKSSGILVRDGNSFRLYTMHGKVDLHQPASR